MNRKKSNIELIIRGGQWGVQLNVKVFPIICPSCNEYFDELYHHSSSRYGQVGSIKCKCGATVHLTDSDNIVEYIKCHSQEKVLVLDFKELYHLRSSDFESIDNIYSYDIFERHLNDTVDLADLIRLIKIENRIEANHIESDIPLPQVVKEWIGLKQRMLDNR